MSTVSRAVPGPGLEQGLIGLNVCTAACGTASEVDTPTVYNLNPTATTYNGPTIPGSALVHGTLYPSAATQAACPAGSCDPRGLGLSPAVKALWSKLPAASTGVLGTSCTFVASFCDGVNEVGYTANVALPTNSDFAVARMDHDFGDKWHFFSSYRFYRLTRFTTNQTELEPAGGIVSTAQRPQIPWFFVAGLTTNLTTNFTNDFHYSYLRNWWQWGNIGGLPQLSGLGAALEPNGESATNVLAPYNVNNQSTRQRYWDGQDHMIRDDMTRLLGNHVLQWGGTFQHNYNQHSRNDNGVSTNEYEVDELGSTSAYNMSGYIPAAVAATSGLSLPWTRYYSDALGMLSLDQIVYPRKGSDLAIQPALTPIVDRVHIPYYNVYFTDSWHLKPSLTLTYGLAWTLEMPPLEENGEQVSLVDAANQLIDAGAYLDTRKKDALLGDVYNPTIGFALVGNAAGGIKYPYNPYYGSFSPRVGMAWNPSYDSGLMGEVFGHGKTVVRGGFSIIYGRLNGVDLVLVPLLGYGLLQTVQCINPTMGGVCPGLGGSSPLTAFRVGPALGGPPIAGVTCTVAPCWDGGTGPLAAAAPTLPQPAFPGINAAAAGASSVLDPDFRPNKSYEFDFTLQRQLGSKFTLEAGYIGRIIRNEYSPIDLNAVPYMFTLGGQSFAKAYANLVMEYCGGVKGLAGGNCAGNTSAVMAQPFFETALGGTTSAYCTGFTSCTAAVAAKEGNTSLGGTGNLSHQLVWDLWTDLDTPFQKANGGALSGFTMENTSGQLSSGVADNASIGYGNYNALFVTTKMADWHGLTMQSNFTYSKALGTGAVVQASSSYTLTDPYWVGRDYGPQNFDRKFVYNMFAVYQPPFYKNQHGLAGHLLGGWSFSPIFVTGSGLPLQVFPSSFNFQNDFYGQAFGEADAVNYFAPEEAVLVPGPGCSNFGTSRINNSKGNAATGVGTTGPYNISIYTNPNTVFNCFRNAVVGFDTGHNGGYGNILRGQPFWNVDMQVRKTTNITERVSAEFQVVFTNLFNHVQLLDPFNALNDPGDWGQLEGEVSVPRTMEFGFRVRF